MSLTFSVPIMGVVVLLVIFHIVLAIFIWAQIVANKLALHSLFTITLIIVLICNMTFFCAMIDYCLRG